MKKAVCCFFMVFFVAQGLMFLRPPDKVLPYENRRAREFPSAVRFSANGLKDFFREVDGALNDRMLARERLVAANGFLGRLIGDIGDLDLAFRGREDWLFLGDNNNHILEKLVNKPSAGTRRTSERHLKSILKGAEQLRAAEILVLPAPNKATVYPEKLPGFLKPAAGRYADQYITQLRKAGLTIADPLEALKSAKGERLLYYRGDTHWNAAGAAAAFQALLDKINSLNRYGRLSLPGFTLVPGDPVNGDLVNMGNFKDYQARPGDNFNLLWTREPPAFIVTDQNGRPGLPTGEDIFPLNDGRVVTVINPAAVSSLTVWFYHDSFGKSLAPFFHAVFAKTVHMERTQFGKIIPPGDPPDLVVLETVERFF